MKSVRSSKAQTDPNRQYQVIFKILIKRQTKKIYTTHKIRNEEKGKRKGVTTEILPYNKQKIII